MTKQIRLFIAIPMSIIAWPFIAVGHSFGLLSARKETRDNARQEVKEGLMCAFIWTIGSFLIWYDYYKTGEIEF